MIPDQSIREAALAPDRSLLVQAPAGSGKTALLILRFLILLARVEQPENVLAMTFTRKAAAEMRERILDALHDAQAEAPVEDHALRLHQAVRAVRTRDREKNWGLLQNPARLNILTIDGFCSNIARAMPLQAQLGAQASIVDDAEAIYLLTAREGLEQAAQMPVLKRPLYLLYLLVDGRRERLETVIAGMLGRREQWQDWIIAGSAQHADLRFAMEKSLHAIREEMLAPLRSAFDARTLQNLAELACFSRDRLQAVGKRCDWEALCTGLDQADYWQAVAAFLLTREGTWRKRIGAEQGLPAGTPEQAAFKALLAGFDDDTLAAQLHACRRMPPGKLAEDTWETLDAMLQILRLCLAQLWLVFQRRKQVDFTAIALAAVRVLGSADAPSERLLALDAQIQHILIDEFQDTSHLQAQLLALLTAGWQYGDGRTLFAVGDPMQSIYRFRKAELSLFLQAWQNGKIRHIPVDTLSLSVNFRSEQQLVQWCNQCFREIFPPRHDLELGAAAHHESVGIKPASHERHIVLHAWTDKEAAGEAQVIVQEVTAALEEGAATVAVLVRQRKHAQAIMAALRQHGISYRAQDMDPLLTRPVIGDLLALTRALLHPADRLYCLALLHSPMVGLSLTDLLVLTENEGRMNLTFPPGMAPLEALYAGIGILSAEGQQRLQRFLSVWRTGLTRYGRMPVADLLRALWLTLGGPLCTDPGGLADAETFFGQILTLETQRMLDVDALSRALERLYAAPATDPRIRVDIMTMHKAKGLQFDTVILPQLSRGTRREDPALILLEERLDGDIIMAPSPARGREHADDRLYKWLAARESARLGEERKRLLYVAITRAERKLVLCGRVTVKGERLEIQGELFKLLWEQVPVERRVVHARDDAPPVPPAVLQRLRADWRPPPLDAPLAVARPATMVEEQLAFWADDAQASEDRE